jgi:gamma-glutamyl:cysteine ligase YbdK (ATP-grasp superfamily)
MFSFGIEHEVAFLNRQGKFADFSNTPFQDFNRIIEDLPLYPDDYSQLRVGDAGIKKKRWYIEGFERFLDSEKVIDCLPKGIEIRTTIHSSIAGAIAELSDSFILLRQVGAAFGFTPVLTSFNPYFDQFNPQPVLNAYELQRRQASPEKQTAHIPMLTYGPDLSLSLSGMTAADLLDIGRKLTFYSPYIVPFSFSAPFYQGQLWEGLSIRTYIRTGVRPSALVFMKDQTDLVASTPSLTKIARISAEAGRIEFKAFDSCDDFDRYAALFALLKGLVLDRSLLGRATVPDVHLHQCSALHGFDHRLIGEQARQVLQAATAALKNDADLQLLQPLQEAIEQPNSAAQRLRQAFLAAGSIESALQQTYKDTCGLSQSSSRRVIN